MDHQWERLTGLLTGLAWRRRLIAGALAATGTAIGLTALSPATPPTVDVVVAADALPGGQTLTSDDLTTAAFSPDTVPPRTLDIDDLVGRVLGGPLDDGEPVTETRIVGPGLLEGWGVGTVAVPVRIADAGSVGLLRPGDHIDLLATSPDGITDASTIAANVPVLTIRPDEDAMATDGALVVIAGTEEQANAVAQAAVTSRLSFTIAAPE